MGETQKKIKKLEEQIIVNDKKRPQTLDHNSARLFTERLMQDDVKLDEVEMIDEIQEEVRLKVRLHNEAVVNVKRVIQAYIKDMNSIYASPTPKLCAFKTIELNEQEKTTIEIDIRPEAFMIIDEKGDCYRDSNEFEVYITIVEVEDKNKMIIGKHPFIKKIHFQNIAGEF